MSSLAQWAVLLPALVFVAVSATMNALFLSSLGHSTVEIWLLACVSVAADIAKAVLPVAIIHTLALRAWGYAVAASAMLAMVLVLSLSSGFGFWAMTRSASSDAQSAQASQITIARQELGEIQSRITSLGAPRALSIIEAELSALKLDRRWTSSKNCRDVREDMRIYCNRVAKAQISRDQSAAYLQAIDARRRLGEKVEALQHDAHPEPDSQISLIATALNLNRELSRFLLTASVAVTLECGSIFLVLLASGPLMRKLQPPQEQIRSDTPRTGLSISADRSHWRRPRGRPADAGERVVCDG